MNRTEPIFAVKKEGTKAIVEIFDEIGPAWAGMIDATTVSRALKATGEVDEIEVRINSPGGDASHGLAIYNLLKNHPATIVTKNYGWAASAASLILVAGDIVEMPRNTLAMIHNSWTIAVGNSKDFAKYAESSEKWDAAIAETYAAKSGRPVAEFRKLMDDETYFSAEEAKSAGLVDVVSGEVDVKATVARPDGVMSSFKRVPGSVAAMVRPPESQKEPFMADKPEDKKTPKTAEASNPAPEKKPEPPEAPEAAAKTITEADLDKARADAIAAENKRQSDVRALCNQAKMPEKSEHFCSDSKITIQDVREHLFEAMCKANSPPPENNTDADPAAGGGDKKDPHAAFRKEFAEHKATLAKVGATDEEAYVRTRCRDEGLDPPPKKAA